MSEERQSSHSDAFDVVKEYHRLLAAEWEKAYERPCAVALPNAAEQAALYGLESRIRSELRTPSDDVPLKCEVIDGAIQFVIGAKVLAHAVNICPDLYDAENDRGRYKVTDSAVFAEELVRTLNHEDEDGSTRLTKMLDEAVAHAIDYGAEGVEENTSAPSGERYG